MPASEDKTLAQAEVPFRLLGIAQFTHCNIECSYCYLQNQDPASFAGGESPYAILTALREMLRAGQLDPGGVPDWGGGEPTLYKEFDPILTLLTQAGMHLDPHQRHAPAEAHQRWPFH